jgi:hypothetical protein
MHDRALLRHASLRRYVDGVDWARFGAAVSLHAHTFHSGGHVGPAGLHHQHSDRRSALRRRGGTAPRHRRGSRFLEGLVAPADLAAGAVRQRDGADRRAVRPAVDRLADGPRRSHRRPRTAAVVRLRIALRSPSSGRFHSVAASSTWVSTDSQSRRHGRGFRDSRRSRTIRRESRCWTF